MTTFLHGVVERLGASGKKADIVSKTHVASNRAGGVTADHWVRRYVINGSPSCDCIWIDEISQLDVGLWLQLSKLTFAGMQFPAFGRLQSILANWEFLQGQHDSRRRLRALWVVTHAC